MKAIILSKNNINKLKQYFNARTISKKNKSHGILALIR